MAEHAFEIAELGIDRVIRLQVHTGFDDAIERAAARNLVSDVVDNVVDDTVGAGVDRGIGGEPTDLLGKI